MWCLQKHIIPITAMLIFIGLFIFFTLGHPLVVFDGDDWGNLTMIRPPFPKWGIWNPIKVFPETLLPVIGYISAYVVYPIYGDYVTSVTLVSAFVVSIFAAGMCVAFMLFCRKIFCMEYYQVALCAIIFISLHFVTFRSAPENNVYLLWSANLTCYIHYVIPNLLNAALVLCFMRWQNIEAQFSALSVPYKAVVVLGLYFAIFSNLLQSYILGIFCLSVLSISAWKSTGGIRGRVSNCLKGNRFISCIVFAWCVSMVFEAFGGRAHGVGSHPLYLYKAAKVTFDFYHKTGKYIPLLILLVAICLAVIYWRSRKIGASVCTTEEKRILPICGLSFIGSVCYVVLICSKAGAGYASRSDVQYGICFFLVCLLFIGISIILRHIKFVQIMLPLVAVLLLFSCFNAKQPFKHATMGNVPPVYAGDVSRALIEQIQTAERAGLKEMTLIVPKGDDRDNWPHPNYMGNAISRTLFAHGLIQRQMKIKIQPDPEMNKEFYHR